MTMNSGWWVLCSEILLYYLVFVMVKYYFNKQEEIIKLFLVWKRVHKNTLYYLFF